MLPLIAINALVVLGPSLLAVYYSFTDWNGIGTAKWIGLHNYIELAGDAEFRNALWHNILWTIFFLVVPMAMGLFGAYALTRIRRFRLLFRVAYFLPYIVASVITAAIWENLLSPDVGIGEVLHLNFLGSQTLALPTVAFVNNWAWWGFLVVVFLAAMQGVNPNLYEAAALDGAGPFRQFWSITLPSIRPAVVVVVTAISIAVLKVFDIVRTMTGGQFGTSVVANEFYSQSFRLSDLGIGSSLAMILFLLVVPIVIYNVRQMRKVDAR